MSADYGRSFIEFGEIIELPHSGLQLIRRELGGGFHDLTGMYPYSMCSDWAALADDAGFLEDTGAASVVFVGDPFASTQVGEACRDWTVSRKFKTHFVVDVASDWRTDCQRKLRNFTKGSLRFQDVELVADCDRFAGLLWSLYQNTIERHGISGIQKLSEAAISMQVSVPGSNLFVARDYEGVTGALMAYQHGATANFHLLFLSERARQLRTSYALIYTMLEEFEKRGCRHVNLGGGAGLTDDAQDGLAKFKSRWTNHTRYSLLCGQVLDGDKYVSLCRRNPRSEEPFFPSYRAGREPRDAT